MNLQLNILKIIETVNDLDSLSDIQKAQLTGALRQYFGQASGNLNELFSKNACIACFTQVVDITSPEKVLYDFWEINVHSGTLFLPHSLELAGIKKIQNSFCLLDNVDNTDLEELAEKLNLAKKVKVPESINVLLNAANEIVQFNNENDVPKRAISWIKFLKEHTLSEALVDKYRAGFDKAVWTSIFRKSRLSESFLAALATDIGWKLISEYHYLSENFINQHSQLLDWQVMSAKQKLSEKQLDDHHDVLDWHAISWAQPLPPTLIEKYKEKLNWESICMYQKLTIDIINNNKDRLTKTCWQNISQKQHLSNDLINTYSDKIDWGFVSMNVNLTDTQVTAYKDKINWNRLINYGRTLSYQQIEDLIASGSIADDDIEDILNERKKFDLTDEQVKELKKTIKFLKKKNK